MFPASRQTVGYVPSDAQTSDPANEPTLLLADEPTGALDSEGGHEVLELFRRLHAGGQTILLVTHDDDVAEAGDRIVRMRDGRVVSEDDATVAAQSSSA